jgi:ATP-binding cassette, subfamily D (ALD), peroxisomal long-chain fatty acid import protein
MQSLIGRRVSILFLGPVLCLTCRIAYISNRRLLLSLADAGGRVMYAYKDLLELAGLTTRLYTLLATLHNVPTMPEQGEGGVEDKGDIVMEHVDVCVPETAEVNASGVGVNGGVHTSHLNGRGNEDGGVHSHAPPLVRDLSFALKEGDHLMITGSNGVGKTAVARVLAGLWAVHGMGACVRRPEDEDEDKSGEDKRTRQRKGMFVVPQRSYMVTGSLLDQMIYPESYADFVESGRTEEELRAILESVWLGYLPEREGGWSARKEWRDVLSGGEKQRVSRCLCLCLVVDADVFCVRCRWRWRGCFIIGRGLRCLMVCSEFCFVDGMIFYHYY